MLSTYPTYITYNLFYLLNTLNSKIKLNRYIRCIYTNSVWFKVDRGSKASSQVWTTLNFRTTPSFSGPRRVITPTTRYSVKGG